VLIIFLSYETNSWWQNFKRESEDEVIVAENYLARQCDSSKIIHELLLLQLIVKVQNVWTVNLLSDQVSHTAQE
jgi:hypothetical protein